MTDSLLVTYVLWFVPSFCVCLNGMVLLLVHILSIIYYCGDEDMHSMYGWLWQGLEGWNNDEIKV